MEVWKYGMEVWKFGSLEVPKNAILVTSRFLPGGEPRLPLTLNLEPWFFYLWQFVLFHYEIIMMWYYPFFLFPFPFSLSLSFSLSEVLQNSWSLSLSTQSLPFDLNYHSFEKSLLVYLLLPPPPHGSRPPAYCEKLVFSFWPTLLQFAQSIGHVQTTHWP